MLSVPENGIVGLEYFRTALFIGDSLTEGFGEYKPCLLYTSRAGAAPLR